MATASAGAAALGGVAAALREAGAWLLFRGPEPPPGETPADPVLLAVLREVEAVRVEQLARARERARLVVPAAVAAAALLALTGLLLLEWWLPVAAVALVGIARAWARSGPERVYQAAFMARVVPQVVARFGDLTYRRGATLDIGRLQALGALPAFHKAVAEDQIEGRYKGVPLRVFCLRLARKQDKKEVVVFSGLVIRAWLPDQLRGTTVLTRDPGRMQKWLDRLGGQGMRRVRLEDPRFEEHFEVFGTDQVEARALLTPAAMERLKTLMRFDQAYLGPALRLEDCKGPRDRLRWMAQQNQAADPGEPPVAVLEGNTVLFALPVRGALGLLSPGSLLRPATQSAGVEALVDDLGKITGAVDAVLAINPKFGEAARGPG